MTSYVDTPLGDAATTLILDVFRLNCHLLAAGDRLVGHLDLTSARWQVLGAIARSDPAQPVSWLARDLGMHRQGVQRITNDLVEVGLVELKPNPHHRRASLVVLTTLGRTTFEAAMAVYQPWIESLVRDFPDADLATARRVLLALRERLSELPGDVRKD